MPVPKSSDNYKSQYFKLIDQLRCRVCLQNQGNIQRYFQLHEILIPRRNFFWIFPIANILLLPCRHLTLCTQCAPYQPEDTCPKCRQEYDVMIDFFWGDQSTTTASKPVAESDQSQAQPIVTQACQETEMHELEFGTDLRLLFNQIIWFRELDACLENKTQFYLKYEF